MNNLQTETLYWALCPHCLGRGKKSRRLRKKVRLQYQKALAEFEKQGGEGMPPERPKGHLDDCTDCAGSGLQAADGFPEADANHYPHVAIVGGGIGGMALAVACLHRGIPFTLYERDEEFSARSQGYGLTLQQASKAIEGFGLFQLQDGVVSTRHLVHTPEGKVVGEWGMRKWLASEALATKNATPKRTNVHIARQALRLALLKQLGDRSRVQWGHKLVDFKDTAMGIELNFQVSGESKRAHADLVVGADGIRSVVRNVLFDKEVAPLRYLGCMVILGICPLQDLNGFEHDLLDSATVFQTANGHERIYIMPYSADSVMWQLSFPMPENEAKLLAAQGPKALKEESCRRTQWHDPIPQILTATETSLVSGYPVYDRALLAPQHLAQADKVTLIGDAAHPMSPFKGQGANQALLDALALARAITKGCGPYTNWRESGIRDSVLTEFEAEMLARSAVKVKGSAEAAEFLHSETVLHEGNEPRGRCLQRK
ncbi:FAD-dependent oxidoreductase [Marinomonas pollencensis]|uniref:2-polyprenyl-6-methoxyphenol hydroxylase-like FAD-dependent oxidoreductase n=1 Tax=Marinomonas pollencensis TaxID=491954 RepID=A0A3E0DTA2_9GAMM|nr:NAD(P)/FAD-dependent oxidoreductase [Marinomonas pollencensis]REG86626.1 2-polyprenyl-6-methoxyphenol hydroxylase-like FAD-dependent oxidoreductase [Marinomonas pollencensis]